MAIASPAPRAVKAVRGRAGKRRSGLLAKALRTPRGRIGLALMALVAAVAAFGPLLAPHSATEFVGTSFQPPGGGHGLLGTDVLGRDVLSRVLDGGWVLLLAALGATLGGLAIGTMTGMVAAYSPGWVDGVIMRTIDIFLSVPAIVFGLLLVSVVGPELWLVIVAVALTHAPQVARVVRAATIEISERDFVHAAELSGVSRLRILVREILPNLVTPLMVESGLRLSYSIILIAGLSFLGFGLQPPSPDWGRMINENRLGLGINAMGVVVPSLLIALLAVGANTFADAIARVAVGLDREEVAADIGAALAMEPIDSDA